MNYPIKEDRQWNGYRERQTTICDDAGIPSPEIEDKYVLNKVDFATVVALKRTYVYYRSKGNRDATDACLRSIEKIRRKPEYRDMYSQKDENGFAISGYRYSSNKETAGVHSIHAHVITEENRLAHDETIVNVSGALLGSKLPNQGQHY